ncbi:MAG: VOC family protein [Acidimicrobiia bacterium]
MTRVAELRLACSVEPWRRIGFEPVVAESTALIMVAGLTLRFEPSAETGAIRWVLAGEPLVDGDVDGIGTHWIDERESSVEGATASAVAVSAVDHIVIMTGDLERTSAAIERHLGLPNKRVRDAGGGVRQGFHRAGDIILEVVQRPDIDPATKALLWGLVLVVDDLDAAVAWLGPDAVGSIRDAVQPGRRIASIRREVGLGLPVALMTPHVR